MFFKEDLATKVYDRSTWEDLRVDDNALEQVSPARVTYGIPTSKNASSLAGWASEGNPDKGSRFHFTIEFPDMKCEEYDRISKGRPVREMMNRIQDQIDRFYEQFDFNGAKE